EGPATYVAGGGFGNWALELTNTTDRTCADIHPVVVLVDDGRALERSQAQLEYFEDAEGTTSRPVTFEETDADELVGVLDEDGDGFTVPAGRTVTVKVRLSVTSDAAVPNDVVANAAVVQRRGDDSEWVGESNDYRFRITDEYGGEDEDARVDEGAEQDGRKGKGKGDEQAGGKDKKGKGGGRDEGGPPGPRESGRADGGGAGAEPEGARDAGPYPGELADSGAGHVLLPYAVGMSALTVGGVLAAGMRRRRR
ncbi:MAG TPA: hypothetical protein VFK43_13750, partial [Acidimicrobiales bacterium]|nr:hypothetical protein [Acidimicrobiales bacterium]